MFLNNFSLNNYKFIYFGRKSFAGNLVNWSTANWIVTNMTETTATLGSICKASSLGNVLIPGYLNMTATIGLCKKLGGKTSVMTSHDTQKQVMDMFYQSKLCDYIGM